MSDKTMIMIGMVVGSTAGAYLPALFGVSVFSIWSIIFSALGGILGIYLTYKWING